VDNDGFGELVVASWTGLRVFGYDEFWTEARPVWNELNYHINNINDNLTVPFSEWNSWIRTTPIAHNRRSVIPCRVTRSI